MSEHVRLLWECDGLLKEIFKYGADDLPEHGDREGRAGELHARIQALLVPAAALPDNDDRLKRIVALAARIHSTADTETQYRRALAAAIVSIAIGREQEWLERRAESMAQRCVKCSGTMDHHHAVWDPDGDGTRCPVAVAAGMPSDFDTGPNHERGELRRLAVDLLAALVGMLDVVSVQEASVSALSGRAERAHVCGVKLGDKSNEALYAARAAVARAESSDWL